MKSEAYLIDIIVSLFNFLAHIHFICKSIFHSFFLSFFIFDTFIKFCFNLWHIFSSIMLGINYFIISCFCLFIFLLGIIKHWNRIAIKFFKFLYIAFSTINIIENLFYILSGILIFNVNRRCCWCYSIIFFKYRISFSLVFFIYFICISRYLGSFIIISLRTVNHSTLGVIIHLDWFSILDSFFIGIFKFWNNFFLFFEIRCRIICCCLGCIVSNLCIVNIILNRLKAQLIDVISRKEIVLSKERPFDYISHISNITFKYINSAFRVILNLTWIIGLFWNIIHGVSYLYIWKTW